MPKSFPPLSDKNPDEPPCQDIIVASDAKRFPLVRMMEALEIRHELIFSELFGKRVVLNDLRENEAVMFSLAVSIYKNELCKILREQGSVRKSDIRLLALGLEKKKVQLAFEEAWRWIQEYAYG